MIDSLCQTYHWTVKEAMALSMPQIIMLCHASWLNAKKLNDNRDVDSTNDLDPEVLIDDEGNRKRLSELTSDEEDFYYTHW